MAESEEELKKPLDESESENHPTISYHSENKCQLPSEVNVACVIWSHDDLSLPFLSPSQHTTPIAAP